MEQMTIWQYMNPTSEDDDITRAMRYPMFEDGEIRIFVMYQLEKDKKKRAAFLKAEYGMGGRSMQLANGDNGFVDFSPKGIKVTSFKRNLTTWYKWADAEKAVARMISEERYLNDEDRRRVSAMDDMPYPTPAFRYP